VLPTPLQQLCFCCFATVQTNAAVADRLDITPDLELKAHVQHAISRSCFWCCGSCCYCN
jgi:hypothetical protein